jgi:hypothetical protein
MKMKLIGRQTDYSKEVNLTSPRSDLEGRVELFALTSTDTITAEVSNSDYRATVSLNGDGHLQFAIGEKGESIPCVFTWNVEKLAELAATQRLKLKVRK